MEHPSESRPSQPVKLPRVEITYCTQCRWMLRAAYFAQELLSTFSTAIGEVALVPSTGGVFTVVLTYTPVVVAGGEADGACAAGEGTAQISAETVLLWDRKAEGGFPETKVLKQRVRDRLEPGRDLGHSDVHGKKKAAVKLEESTGEAKGPAAGAVSAASAGQVRRNPDGSVCEDCG
ncbi:Rdx family-domain-containing protein [Lineolata rhizophorae]|uniref:Rdx family-domain-containing protein n=1 Tax=Lineolata rhizophorae TaxID=578093 RepID=A0A6A6PDQ6_9PEZI|nr:Rdx family-domain-containing protein [Lineolata rhizophorae]